MYVEDDESSKTQIHTIDITKTPQQPIYLVSPYEKCFPAYNAALYWENDRWVNFNLDEYFRPIILSQPTQKIGLLV